MEKLSIYIGAENPDHFDIHDLAALYNVSITAIGPEYAVVEGEGTDLDQFAEFWSSHVFDNSQEVFYQ